MKLENINLNEIIPDENQPRKEFEGIEDLAMNIEEQGLIQPIEVRPTKDNYIIIDGERRYKAYNYLGKENILCIINKSANEILLRQLATDIHKNSFEFSERMEAIEQLVKIGYTKKEIIKNLGISKGYLTTLIFAIDLEPETKQFIKEQKLTGREIKEIRKEKNKNKSEPEIISEIKLSKENILDFFTNHKKEEIYLDINRSLNYALTELHRSYSLLDRKRNISNKNIVKIKEKVESIENLFQDIKGRL